MICVMVLILVSTALFVFGYIFGRKRKEKEHTETVNNLLWMFGKQQSENDEPKQGKSSH